MLLTLIIPFIILSLTLSIHYQQHFKLRLCGNKAPNNNVPMTTKQNSFIAHKAPNSLRLQPHKVSVSVGTAHFREQQNKKNSCWKSCGCSLLSKDDEKFDFFPASFFYYIVFELGLITFMIVVQFVDYYAAHNAISIDILLSVHARTRMDALLYIFLDNIGAKNQRHTLQLSDYVYLDFVLMYSVMVLLIWESLFSFWKYYSTKIVCQKYALVNTQDIIRRFALYAATFTAIFSSLLHVHYLLWPIALIVHCGFNLCCTMKFASILVEKYRLFIEVDDEIEKNDNESIIRNVYSMRNFSVTCTLLGTFYLAFFSISYSVCTIYYLPIFWCLSSSIFSLNFVRNRKFLLFKLFQLKQRISSRKVTATGTETEEARKNEMIATHHDEPRKYEAHLTTDNIAGGGATATIHTKFSSVDTESACAAAPNQQSSHEESTDDIAPMAIQRVYRSAKKSSKALQLLGIEDSNWKVNGFNHLNGIKSINVRPIHLVYSQSDIIANRSGTISEMYGEQNLNKNIATKAAPKCPNKMKMKTSHSDITDTNKKRAPKAPVLESIVDLDQELDFNDDESSVANEAYVPRTPLRRFSSDMPSSPPIATTTIVTFNVGDIDYIDDDDDDGMEYIVDYAAGELVIEASSEQIFLGKSQTERTPNIPHMEPPLELIHHKSTSEPIDIQEISNNIDVEQIMSSLNLMSKYGFCSRRSINSLYQLTKYKDKVNIHYQRTK